MEWFYQAYRQWTDRHRKFIASQGAYFEEKKLTLQRHLQREHAAHRCAWHQFIACN